jgi:hypothetical protein
MHARPLTELEAGMAEIRRSPADAGRVERIARRPATGEREVVETATLDTELGVVGDGWVLRGSKRMPDGSSDPEAQVTIMNSRVAALLSGGPIGWEIAGDQLYVDLDLSVGNLPPGTRLTIGSAMVEVSAVPHRGCVQFSGRFGPDALRFASTPSGQELRLRGVNTRIVQSGVVRIGDLVSKA